MRRSSRSLAHPPTDPCPPSTPEEPDNPTIDIDFLEQFLRVAADKKGSDLTYQDILKVATLSKELYEKTKHFRKQCYTNFKAQTIKAFKTDLQNLNNLSNLGRDPTGPLAYYVVGSDNEAAEQAGFRYNKIQFFIRRNRPADRTTKYLQFILRFSNEGKLFGLYLLYGNARQKETLFMYTQYPNFLKVELNEYTPAPVSTVTGRPLYRKSVKENPFNVYHDPQLGDMLIHKKLETEQGNAATYQFFRTYMMITFLDYLMTEFDLSKLTRLDILQEDVKRNLGLCKEMLMKVAGYAAVDGGSKRKLKV